MVWQQDATLLLDYLKSELHDLVWKNKAKNMSANAFIAFHFDCTLHLHFRSRHQQNLTFAARSLLCMPVDSPIKWYWLTTVFVDPNQMQVVLIGRWTSAFLILLADWRFSRSTPRTWNWLMMSTWNRSVHNLTAVRWRHTVHVFPKEVTWLSLPCFPRNSRQDNKCSSFFTFLNVTWSYVVNASFTNNSGEHVYMPVFLM